MLTNEQADAVIAAWHEEKVKCAACGCVIARDDADRRDINEDDEPRYVCQTCSEALDALERICR